MKKVWICLLLVGVMLSLAACGGQDDMIGKISGVENEYITIDGITYLIADSAENGSNDFSSADRGDYLGSVTNGKITMKVYTVKGDDSGDFLYALWDWEGAFYVRQYDTEK